MTLDTVRLSPKGDAIRKNIIGTAAILTSEMVGVVLAIMEKEVRPRMDAVRIDRAPPLCTQGSR